MEKNAFYWSLFARVEWIDFSLVLSLEERRSVYVPFRVQRSSFLWENWHIYMNWKNKVIATDSALRVMKCQFNETSQSTIILLPPPKRQMILRQIYVRSLIAKGLVFGILFLVNTFFKSKLGHLLLSIILCTKFTFRFFSPCFST